MRHLILVLVAALTLFTSSHAYAQQSIREWTNQADVVCVASVASIRKVEDGTPPFTSQIPVTALLVTLRIQASLKGNVTTQELPLEIYRFNLEALQKHYPNGFGLTGAVPFSDMKVGKVYLIFAKKFANDNRFFLSIMATVIPVRLRSVRYQTR